MKSHHVTNLLIILAAAGLAWIHLNTRTQIAALREELVELKVFHKAFTDAFQASFAPQINLPAPLNDSGEALPEPDVAFDIVGGKIIHDSRLIEISSLETQFPVGSLSAHTRAGIRIESEADPERTGPIVQGLMKFLSTRGVNNIALETIQK